MKVTCLKGRCHIERQSFIFFPFSTPVCMELKPWNWQVISKLGHLSIPNVHWLNTIRDEDLWRGPRLQRIEQDLNRTRLWRGGQTTRTYWTGQTGQSGMEYPEEKGERKTKAYLKKKSWQRSLKEMVRMWARWRQTHVIKSDRWPLFRLFPPSSNKMTNSVRLSIPVNVFVEVDDF